MHVHLQVLILAQVKVRGAIDGLRLSLRQVLHNHTQRLLVSLGELWLRGVCHTRDAWWHDVVDRTSVVVLLDVHGADLHQTAVRRSRELLVIDAPFSTHQVKTAESQHDGLLELCQEHTHKADAGEVADAPYPVVILRQGDAELVPLHGFLVAIAQRGRIFADISDEVMSQAQVLGTDADLVLIVALILVQRIVLVDILDVGECLIRRVVALRLLVVVGGVALWHVDTLVALQNAGLARVKVAATIVVVVVVGRVLVPGSPHAVVHGDMTQEVGIGREAAFLLIVQTVQTHILLGTGAAGGGEGVCLGGLCGNSTPLGGHIRAGAIDRHTTLIEFLAIVQDVLADLTEVDVEVTAIVSGIGFQRRIDEGIEEPEFDILHVGCLEVVGIQLTHHTAPVALWQRQRTIHVDLRIQVVRTTLLGIVRQVQDGQRVGGSAVCRLVAVRIELTDIHRTHIMVRQLVEVALDMGGCQTRRTVGEQRVDGVPRQQGTVVVARHGVLVDMFREHRGHTRQRPRLRFHHVDAAGGTLEVVNIRGIVLRTGCRAGNEMGEFSRKGYLRGLRTMQQWQLVEHVRQPLAFCLPVDVQTPQGVLQRLGTHRHLRRQGLLRQVLQRTTNLEVLREVVLPVEAHHRLALHAVVAVRL